MDFFSVVQAVHLAGIAAWVGSLVLVDLRVLGLGPLSNPVSELSSRLAPWARAGLLVLLVTGPVLFFSDAVRYSSNPAFRVKMMLLAVAAAFHFAVRRRRTRITAIVSLLLWTAVVAGGRAIADFDV
jgi:putative copper export protein